MIRVPAKYKRFGIKVKCLQCGYQVSHNCKGNGKGIAACLHKKKHRFNLIVVVPGGKGKRRMRLLETRDFNQALIELKNFKEELVEQGYHKVQRPTLKEPKTLIDFSIIYLDTLSGVNTPEHLVRKRSREHVADVRRGMEKFFDALGKKGYVKETLLPSDIGDNEVGIFHNYLLNDLGLAPRTYNKYMTVLKSFFSWLIESKDLPIRNCFKAVEMQPLPKKENTIITKSEFEALLTVITPENGEYTRTDGAKKNIYRPWLSVALRLALETGLRREELFMLKWSDLHELESSKHVFKLENLKVNRIMRSSSSMKYVPLTHSLKALLDELDFESKKGTDEYIIERNNDNLNYLKDELSRGFTHYFKLISDRDNITFKSLRKTYISHLAMALGERTALLTGHTNNEVLRNHYLSGAFVVGNLGEFRIF